MVTPVIKEYLPAQDEFMEALEEELLYSGAFGAGKSRIGCEKCLYLALKYPNNYGLITRKRFNDIKFTTMIVFFRDVVPPALKEADGYDWNKTDSILTLPNGSQVVFRGLDDPGKIASMELGYAFVDEATEISEEDWDMINGRLRLKASPFYQIFGATNPGPPRHWLYQRFVVHPEEGVHRFLTSNALQNYFLPPEYIKRISRYKGRYYDRYVLGKWVGFEGTVYDNWDSKVNICRRFDLPIDWPRWRVVDFGFVNPFTCEWWTRNPETGDWYMYKELYKTQTIVEDHAKVILEHSMLITGVPEKYERTYCDWDAEDRITLGRHGVPATNARKDVSPGIQTCYELIGGGKIHVFEDCLIEEDQLLLDAKKPTSMLDEVYIYEWAVPPAKGKPGEKSIKEEPKKFWDHGMDAMRMLIYTVEFALKAGQDIVQGKDETAWPLRDGSSGGGASFRVPRQADDKGMFAGLR